MVFRFRLRGRLQILLIYSIRCVIIIKLTWGGCCALARLLLLAHHRKIYNVRLNEHNPVHLYIRY